MINVKCLATNLSSDFGSVTSVSKTQTGCNIQTNKGFVAISFYSTEVVRIRMTLDKPTSDFSYAVILQPSETKFTMVDDDRQIAITSDSAKVIVQKNPLRISIYNSNGKLLVADDALLGTQVWNDEITTFKKMHSDEKYIGLGEKTGPLNKRGYSFTNWNTDDFAYTTEADPLYKTIPFYIGIHDSVCYGLFLDNSYKSNFNFGGSTDERMMSFTVESGEMNYYILCGDNIERVIKNYTQLTGTMPMPPLWSLGYQQCRWSYYPDKEVLTVARTFRDKKIPCDVIYNDIDYMDRYRIFTFNKEKFPEPGNYADSLKSMGFKLAVIVDPGIAIADDYAVHKDGLTKSVYVKYPTGDLYIGNVWPGRCNFPDFTLPMARQWWGANFKTLTQAGVRGFWNDMNEPAAWGQNIPNQIIFDYDGNKTTMKQARNVYGMQMSRATFEGIRKILPNERVFNLTRATYAGGQRYSAVWTGDNDASDDHMMMSSRMIQSLNLSGFSFAGADIGGFANEPSKELFIRWLSMAVYTPFFRNHTMINTRDKEPWALGEETESMARECINTRYKLLPYIYTAFYESHTYGKPVVRSLCMDNMNDNNVYSENYQNQFMLGNSLLICPVSSKDRFAKIYLPSGRWYKYRTNEKLEGAQSHIVEAPLWDLPVFAKGGQMIATQPVIQNTTQSAGDTLTITVYYDNKITTTKYYEDDGVTFDYEKGNYYLRNMTFVGTKRQLVFEKAEGKMASKFKFTKLIFVGTDAEVIKVKTGSETKQLPSDNVKNGTVVLPWNSEKFEVLWFNLE
ncbi:MAG: glycoside hydrolase family 31 protein [Bacteroidetes bacterium]|nr:glycoside hydrolase family 31 protein [Bacteroidota bacterium]